MKKEHNEHMERHKADINQQKETLWRNKVLMDLWSQKSDHAEALHKQKDSSKMEAHRKLCNQNRSIKKCYTTVWKSWENITITLWRNWTINTKKQCKRKRNRVLKRSVKFKPTMRRRLGKEAIEKLKAGCKRTRISPSSRPSSGTWNKSMEKERTDSEIAWSKQTGFEKYDGLIRTNIENERRRIQKEKEKVGLCQEN